MTRERLQELLQAGVELELSTIPPYLCALYTIKPQGNDEAKLVIRSVVVEEMLHMVLAANVLNAIGGEPKVTGDHAPRYPHELPDGVVLHLLPFSPEAVDAFCKVENPAHPFQPLDPDHPLLGGRRHEHHLAAATEGGKRPGSIGEFYAEIVQGLEAAAAELGEEELFNGDVSRQIDPAYYYAGGGSILPVTDLASAKRALDEIVEQGEGDMGSMFDEDGDLAHYYRFLQLKHGRAYEGSEAGGAPLGAPVAVDYGSIFPMVANPHPEDYDDELRAAAERVDRTWSELLVQIEAAFNGAGEALLPAINSMFKLRDQTLVLLANPLPGAPGRTAGPTFAWVPAVEPLLELPL